MELRILRYFLTVAKEQSFTKAAEQLHITQPTLSRQLTAFEEELGIKLFLRKGKNIMLTEKGILLKRRALEILNLEERTLEELKGTEEVIEGTVTVGCGEFAPQFAHFNDDVLFGENWDNQDVNEHCSDLEIFYASNF